MANASLAVVPNEQAGEKIVAFDRATLLRLWEIQSIVRITREATEPDCDSDFDQEHIHFVMKGIERLLDSAIRRNGQNSALQFNGEG